MKRWLVVLAPFAATCFGAPSATVLSVAQDAETHLVTVTYALNEVPAIVTFGVETNRTGAATGAAEDWVAVEGSAVRAAYGDVNRIIRVAAGSYTVKWRPDRSWPYQAFASGAARVAVKVWPLDNPPDFMAFNLAAGGDPLLYESKDSMPHDLTNDIYKTDFLVMRRIPAKSVTWRMGSPEGEPGRSSSHDLEHPHMVTLTNDYYMGIFELTKRQLVLISGGGYSQSIADTMAGNWIAWKNLRGGGADYFWPRQGHAVAADSYIGKLRSLSGQDFDLPTEAQWEYAARAGAGTAFCNGSDSFDDAMGLSWYKEHGLGLHPVGLCPPNAWDLYDVHGNVAEWCLDWMSYDNTSFTVEPEGPLDPPNVDEYTADCRVVRGGSHAEAVSIARSARRGWCNPNSPSGSYYGARLCLPLPLK